MTTAAAHASPGARSIGAALKARRQELQLSVQDIASQMRLDPRIINAIEADRHDGLPAPLYVRGYIRGYAKILKIDPGPLVELYDAEAPAAPPEIIPEVKHPTQTSSSDKPVKAFTYLVTFTLVILVVAWWQSSFVVKTAPAPAAENAAAQSPQPQLQPADVPREPSGAPDGGYSAPAEEGPAAGSDSSAPASVTTPVADQGSIAGGVPGPDRVVFRLNSDSWVEVFDSHGERLYMSLARSGEVVSLTGTAPFSVLLGYAQGVNVEFNGHAFDPSPYSRSGIARFTLSN